MIDLKQHDSTFSARKKSLEESLFSRLGTQQIKKICVFGAHLNGKKIAQVCQKLSIEIECFIDNDKLKHGSTLAGQTIKPLDSIHTESIIVIASGRHALSIIPQLQQSRHHKFLTFMEFAFLLDLPFQAENSIRNFTEDLFLNEQKYSELFDKLKDEFSRQTLSAICNYRMTWDIFSLREVICPHTEEYFDQKILKLTEHESFVDIGAFDGDTVTKFIKLTNNKFDMVRYIEPDHANFTAANKLFVEDQRIRGFECGLHSSNTELRFNANGDIYSNISGDGEIIVKVRKLDDLIDTSVSLIKADIEGSEPEMIIGAVETIRRHRPKIAFAAYHRATDLWNLPAQLLKIIPDYQFFFRHYSQSHDDTTLYGI